MAEMFPVGWKLYSTDPRSSMNPKYRKHEGNNTKAHLKLLNNNDKVLKTAGKKWYVLNIP